MKKSFPHHNTLNQDDNHDILSHTKSPIYESINIDDQSPFLNSVEDSYSSYRCIFNKCEAILENKIDLEEHCSRHIKTKHFKCEVNGCEKIYRSKENLTLHIKNIHLNLKPYKCRFCSSTFSHRNGIIRIKLGKTYHERKLHINYLPYKCNIESINSFIIRL